MHKCRLVSWEQRRWCQRHKQYIGHNTTLNFVLTYPQIHIKCIILESPLNGKCNFSVPACTLWNCPWSRLYASPLSSPLMCTHKCLGYYENRANAKVLTRSQWCKTSPLSCWYACACKHTEIHKNAHPLTISKLTENGEQNHTVRGGADKSLARSGSKKAKATKLVIYSTYSPQNSKHFLACCSTFCKTLEKNSEGCLSNQVFTATMTFASGEKWWPSISLSLFFPPQFRAQVVVRQGQIQRIGWVIKTLETQVGQFLLGCKCPVR